MKKSQPVKTKITRLLKRYGGNYKALAKDLGCHWSYPYKLKNGMVPGKRLYRDICELYDKVMAQ
jgi:hypothetical protein